MMRVVTIDGRHGAGRCAAEAFADLVRRELAEREAQDTLLGTPHACPLLRITPLPSPLDDIERQQILMDMEHIRQQILHATMLPKRGGKHE